MDRSTTARILLSLWLLAGSAAPVAAERFLTVTDAQNICFPQADRFDAQTIRFTPEQARAIARHSGVTVRNPGNRFWLAHQGNTLLGVLFVDYVLGKHELIDYVVAISPDGKVERIEILEYRESYGGQIRGAKWRGQFKGKSATAPLGLHNDIYNISGATISCRHVTEGVKRVLATFEHLVRPRLPVSARLPDAGSASGS